MKEQSSCIDHGQKGGRQGYGRKSYNGKAEQVHRLAYCKHHNIDLESIKGLVIRHTCDNSRCVNPAHLLLGTQLQNMADMSERNRSANRKLTTENVLEVIEFCKPLDRGHPGNDRTNSIVYFAIKFSVRPNSISRILNRITYKHVWRIYEQTK